MALRYKHGAEQNPLRPLRPGGDRTYPPDSAEQLRCIIAEELPHIRVPTFRAMRDVRRWWL